MLLNAYSRPNGWTDWAEFACGHLWVAGARLKKIEFFFKIFFHGQRRSLQLVYNIEDGPRETVIFTKNLFSRYT